MIEILIVFAAPALMGGACMLIALCKMGQRDPVPPPITDDERDPWDATFLADEPPIYEPGMSVFPGEPPCLECGANTEEEAQTLCHCAGDKDDCHGCQLWP